MGSFFSYRRKRHGEAPRFEPLENRLLLAGAWQNSVLQCDVDDSGLVTPTDVLHVINALNEKGIRPLSAQSPQPIDMYVDVSGDNLLSPIDALLVINALNRATPEVPLALSIDAADDPNGNGTVLIDTVRLRGQTSAFSKVVLSSDRVAGSPTSPAAWTVSVDFTGQFSMAIPLASGVNRLEFKVIDELGRELSRVRELRRGDVVTDWNAAVLNVIRDWTTTSNDPFVGRIVNSRPPEVARNLAMIHTAMFDAVNAVEARYQFYAFSGSQVPDASPEAAAAMAAHEVASALYSAPDELSVWSATLTESLRNVPEDARRVKGIELGKQAAQAILARRADDGANLTVQYQPGSEPGDWQRTFPDYLPALLPQWPSVKPFVVSRAEDYRAIPPPELSSNEYAVAVDEVMRLGSLNSNERTAPQKEIAIFWADGGGTATPPGHWNRIATDVVQQESLALIDSARTLALLNLALADAGIASWDSKYFYDLWRPIDAIRLADTDGNAATVADTSWTPLLRTPPFPAYTSGHSTFSGAASEVLTTLFGGNYAFRSSSDAHSGFSQRPLDESLIVTRSFTSFEQAAQEAGLSRIYGGIHFAFDNSEGLATGKAVARTVVTSALQAV